MPQLKTRFLAPIAASIFWTFAQTATAEAFRVCADPANPPFSNRAEQGFENEIAALFAKDLGQTVEYTWFPQRIGFIRNTLKAKLPETDDYKCDVVMGVPAGYELTLTTRPYYRSTYVLIYVKNRGLDDISSPEDLAALPAERKRELRIAMFDRGPGTAWLHKHGLSRYGIPYQSMSGDARINSAMAIEKDMRAGVVDMVIIWGPMTGHFLSSAPEGTFAVLPMTSTPDIRFDFSIAMGVRHGDKARKAQLDDLIDKHSDQIEAILRKHHVPLLEPAPIQEREDDDD